MVDITDSTTEYGPTDTHKRDAEGNPIRRSKSGGEIAFDRVVYTGIGFGVNEAMSLWITDQFKNGSNLLEKLGPLKTPGKWFSKDGFTRISQFIADTFKLAPIEKLGEQTITPLQRGGNTLLMATLLIGGTLLVWPMKKIEDHKNYWVKKANHVIDRFRSQKLSAEEVVKRDEEVEQAIACSPKQSWPSLIIGRGVAMLASWGTGTWMGKARNERVEDFSENVLTGAMKESNKLFAGTDASPLGRFANWDTTKRYTRLVGLETYSCLISSTVLEIVSKMLSGWRSTVHDPELCKEGKEEQPAPAPVAPAGSNENTDTKARTAVEPKVSLASREAIPVSHAEQIRRQQAETQPTQAL